MHWALVLALTGEGSVEAGRALRKLLVLGFWTAGALAALGVGYAFWSTNVIVSGTVNTGSVGIEWSIEEPGWDAESPEKDVSSIECVIDGSTLSVTVRNAYPSMDYLCTFDVHSVGTVPVHLSELVFSGLPNGFEVKIQDENGFPACFAGIQLHESDAVWATLHLHLTNDVPNASTTYTFTGEITAFQWNESPAGLDCPTAPVVFLLIDEDTIDDGIQTIQDFSFNDPFCGNGVPSVCVNDDIAVDAGSGLTTPLFSRDNDIYALHRAGIADGASARRRLVRSGPYDPRPVGFHRRHPAEWQPARRHTRQATGRGGDLRPPWQNGLRQGTRQRRE